MKHTYTVEELQEAVAASISLADVLRRLNVIAAGGNYATVKKRIDKYAIDISHFTGQAHNRNRVIGPKRPLEELLVCNSSTRSHVIKRRLINENLKDHRCEICDLTEWLGKPIPLELHHINGKSNDHRLENLQILCNNCHAQTDNYRGKNIGKYTE